MTDEISKAGFGDAALASKVIEEYADGLDALTREECKALDIDAQRCDSLTQALGKGKEGIVTNDEYVALEKFGFSRDFINTLSGKDGKNALHARVKWLAGNCVTRADASDDVRISMIGEIGFIGPDAKDAVPALIEALRNSKWGVRRAAAWALGMIGAPAVPAVPALIEVLKDEDSYVRLAAARTLGKIGTPAVPALIEALRDEDRYVRSAAAWALGKIGPAAKHAIPTLERMRDSDPNAYCRRAAEEAIEKIAGD